MEHHRPGAELRELFESLPLSAFNTEDASDLERLLPALFGDGTVCAPMYHCGEVGGWLLGRSVLVPRPKAVHAFVLRSTSSNAVEWASLSRGQRINLLTDALDTAVWSAEDVPGLVLALADQAEVQGMSEDWFRFDEPGTLNHQMLVWVLAHVLSRLDADEVEPTGVLLALRLRPDLLALLRRLVLSVWQVQVNWEHVDEAGPRVAEAAERLAGVRWDSRQVEQTGVAGRLLRVPYEAWEEQAYAMVLDAYESGRLDKDFFPAEKPEPVHPELTGWSTVAV